MRELIRRDKYLERALAFRDTDLVKVVTGVRRCGKSSLLALVRKSLLNDGVGRESIISMNLEDIGLGVRSGTDLYDYVKGKSSGSGKAYVFIDEVQRVPGWHDAVNALRVALDCDIYVTGSNAFLLSSELSTYLSGRYVEVKMLPLVPSEYADFCGVAMSPSAAAGTTADGGIMTTQELMSRYLAFGGMPAIASLRTTQQMHSAYMDSLVEAVVVRDILSRERPAAQRRISDPALLRALAAFLADNIGKATSLNKVANTLTSAGNKTSRFTASGYAQALADAYLFYPCSRYDIHGKDLLKTAPKYYVVDLGIRSALGGYRNSDIGRAFENVVYLQLVYDGWKVHVGKLYDREVDFVANKDGRVAYIQVVDEMIAQGTLVRELAPLRSIRDNHEKTVVVRQGAYPDDIDGIRIMTPDKFFF